jgi:hypothetical protein
LAEEPWYHIVKQEPRDRTSGSRTLVESHPEGLTRKIGFSGVEANGVDEETSKTPEIDIEKSRPRAKADMGRPPVRDVET